MVNDLGNYFSAQDKVAQRVAEWEGSIARLELARMHEHMAMLLSQCEPVDALGLDREVLRLVLQFIRHGDLKRLEREHTELLLSASLKRS